MKTEYFKENILAEALKYENRGDFVRFSSGHYSAAKKMGILREACSHMPKRAGVPHNKKWTPENLQAEANLYSDRDSFSKKSPLAYRAAIKQGMLDNICQHMPKLKAPKGFWVTENIQAEALKYTRRCDFLKSASGAYDAANTLGVLDKICSHMDTARAAWTPEDLKEEAKKYTQRSTFMKGSSGAYGASINLGILDEVCSHMVVVGGVSVAETSLLSEIQKKYPKAQKLIDRKVNIENKPHIQGFHVDIYIPELRKGIEFDGDYWHSVSGLSRSREDWPKEDLENYHKIKDEHFDRKGIQILHVSEKEWASDQKRCISKCFSFLEVPYVR